MFLQEKSVLDIEDVEAFSISEKSKNVKDLNSHTRRRKLIFGSPSHVGSVAATYLVQYQQ